MATREECIQKNEQKFYALIQIGFDEKNPVFVLGEKEIPKRMMVADMYDKKEDTIKKDCILYVDNETLVQTSAHKSINLTAPTSWIDAGTPRYWFTNTNRD